MLFVTGLVGGSNPVFDEVIISMSRMNKIINIDHNLGQLSYHLTYRVSKFLVPLVDCASLKSFIFAVLRHEIFSISMFSPIRFHNLTLFYTFYLLQLKCIKVMLPVIYTCKLF